MADPANGELEDELVDYEEEEALEADDAAPADTGKKGYVGIHSVGFKDFQLKPELIRAIQDCGFEHPSEIQQECLPLALVGQDILGQAKSGMGKTAVFVLSILHQLEIVPGEIHAIVFAHTRELAGQIESEFKRFSKFMKDVRIGCYVGGIAKDTMVAELKDEAKRPQIIVGTPGRLLDLVKDGSLSFDNIKYFVVDECDKILDQLDMRSDIQRMFLKCPKKKQVMMFSATMTDTNREIAKKFMRHPQEKKMEEAKLTLDGLVQHYVVLKEGEKSRKLTDLLDKLDFNQCVIFVSSVQRANLLAKLLSEAKFPVACIHGSQKQSERNEVMRKFKHSPNETRILVSTDLVARGVDVERVNVVINYDMPETNEKKGNGADTYLHRVGRAGRFGTRGLAITFVCSKEETEILNSVQDRFDVDIQILPDEVDKATYTNVA